MGIVGHSSDFCHHLFTLSCEVFYVVTNVLMDMVMIEVGVRGAIASWAADDCSVRHDRCFRSLLDDAF